MRSRPRALPAPFRAYWGDAPIALIATPPDETDPATDYLWQLSAPAFPDWPVGRGFTSHQAMHDLLERLQLLDIALTGVVQIHDAS